MPVVNLTGELVQWLVVLGKERSCSQEPQFHLLASVLATMLLQCGLPLGNGSEGSRAFQAALSLGANHSLATGAQLPQLFFVLQCLKPLRITLPTHEHAHPTASLHCHQQTGLRR